MPKPNHSTNTKTHTAATCPDRSEDARANKPNPGLNIGFLRETKKLIERWDPDPKDPESRDWLLEKFRGVRPFKHEKALQTVSNIAKHTIREFRKCKEQEALEEKSGRTFTIPEAIIRKFITGWVKPYYQEATSDPEKITALGGFDPGCLLLNLGQLARLYHPGRGLRSCIASFANSIDIPALLNYIANYGNTQSMSNAALGLSYALLYLEGLEEDAKIRVCQTTFDGFYGLLEGFLVSRPNARDIADFLLACSNLAGTGMLQRVDRATLKGKFDQLSDKFLASNPNALDISIFFLSWADLVRENVLFKVRTFTLNGKFHQLLDKFLDGKPNASNIANLLLAWSRTVRKKPLSKLHWATLATLNDKFYQLLDKFLDAKSNASNIAIFFSAWSNLTQAGMLSTIHPAILNDKFDQLLAEFLDSDPSAQDIFTLLLTWNYYAQANELFDIRPTTINGLLNMLLAFNLPELDPSPKDIAATLYLACWLWPSAMPNLDHQTIESLADNFLLKIDQADSEDITRVARAFCGMNKTVPPVIVSRLQEVKPTPSYIQEHLCSLDPSRIKAEELVMEFVYTDFAIDERIIIELDGEDHCYSSGEVKGKDTRRDRHLTEHGYEIVRFQSHYKDRIREMKEFFKALLRAAMAPEALKELLTFQRERENALSETKQHGPHSELFYRYLSPPPSCSPHTPCPVFYQLLQVFHELTARQSACSLSPDLYILLSETYQLLQLFRELAAGENQHAIPVSVQHLLQHQMHCLPLEYIPSGVTPEDEHINPSFQGSPCYFTFFHCNTLPPPPSDLPVTVIYYEYRPI